MPKTRGEGVHCDVVPFHWIVNSITTSANSVMIVWRWSGNRNLGVLTRHFREANSARCRQVPSASLDRLAALP